MLHWSLRIEPVFLQIGDLLTLYRTAHFVAIGHLSLV